MGGNSNPENSSISGQVAASLYMDELGRVRSPPGTQDSSPDSVEKPLPEKRLCW